MIFSLLIPLSSSEQNSQREYSLDPWVKGGDSVRPRSEKTDSAEGAARVPRAPALQGSQSERASSQPGCECVLRLDTCSSALLVSPPVTTWNAGQDWWQRGGECGRNRQYGPVTLSEGRWTSVQKRRGRHTRTSCLCRGPAESEPLVFLLSLPPFPLSSLPPSSSCSSSSFSSRFLSLWWKKPTHVSFWKNRFIREEAHLRQHGWNLRALC